ncbi:hypothetical protein RD110_03985 [Rhodoferax koreense]|uniref:NYN domain-containing protein n=2 Tax=Rhodoferax koreensis TaxID=1842727 RepID=A0A1P8JRS6_9BURK|nr:hypothetical protein RD110_03985 [Rhodoferax koreense]
MQGRGGVALLIDADNLSSPEAVEEALRKLTELCGPVAIRRAYGSADNLKGLAGVMRELAIRPIINDPLSKNTTDILLAVDALDLWYQCAPSVMAIGTGDADFAPLVLRLRERGVRLICFSQKTKLSPDIRSYYEQVLIVRAKSAGDSFATPLQAVAPQPRIGAPAPQPAPAAAPAPARRAAPAKKAASRAKAVTPKAGAKSVTKAESVVQAEPSAEPAPPSRMFPTRAEAVPTIAAEPPAASAKAEGHAQGHAEDIQAILLAVPGLQDGQSVALNEAVRLLHDAKLLGKNASSVKFFKKHAAHFELTPDVQPTRLRFTS